MRDARLLVIRLWDGFCEKHAYERPAPEKHVYETVVYGRGMPMRGTPRDGLCEMHVSKMHACQRHAYEVAYEIGTPMRDMLMGWSL
jgi:hypothetical protein